MTMPWLRDADPRRRARAAEATAHLRVSDAERGEVADRLARHYGDGRLDQAELDERLGRAMAAKTRADLDALLADLPEPGPAPGAGPGGPGRAVAARPAAARPRRFLPLMLLVLLIITAGHLLLPWGWFWPGGWFGFPWLWIALLVFIWLRRGRCRSAR